MAHAELDLVKNLFNEYNNLGIQLEIVSRRKVEELEESRRNLDRNTGSLSILKHLVEIMEHPENFQENQIPQEDEPNIEDVEDISEAEELAQVNNMAAQVAALKNKKTPDDAEAVATRQAEETLE